MTPEEIKNLVGPKKPTSWKTITVHHSASLQGCAASFDRFHH
jgi:hypothetical protein